MSKEREAFEAWVIENLAEGRSMSWEDWCWKAWQAAKAQAVPASIGDIQSWIAVNPFSALDAVHDNVPIVDANELAKYINSLDLSVSVPEGFKLMPLKATENMVEAACDISEADESWSFYNIYEAMVSSCEP